MSPFRFKSDRLLEIYNISGCLLSTFTIHSQQTVITNNLTKGLVFFVFKSKNMLINTQKIVIP
ncbi:MAG: T9SS type A sorting domain-containing protein [Salinivirgaceae bacterium]|nr:T9SS type A sorting domain-containing protein [Salinivirgaceae bacterium]